MSQSKEDIIKSLKDKVKNMESGNLKNSIKDKANALSNNETVLK